MDKEDTVPIHNGIQLSPQKNERMPSAATWVQPEMIILRETSHNEKGKTI